MRPRVLDVERREVAVGVPRRPTVAGVHAAREVLVAEAERRAPGRARRLRRASRPSPARTLPANPPAMPGGCCHRTGSTSCSRSMSMSMSSCRAAGARRRARCAARHREGTGVVIPGEELRPALGEHADLHGVVAGLHGGGDVPRRIERLLGVRRERLVVPGLLIRLGAVGRRRPRGRRGRCGWRRSSRWRLTVAAVPGVTVVGYLAFMAKPPAVTTGDVVVSQAARTTTNRAMDSTTPAAYGLASDEILRLAGGGMTGPL